MNKQASEDLEQGAKLLRNLAVAISQDTVEDWNELETIASEMLKTAYMVGEAANA